MFLANGHQPGMGLPFVQWLAAAGCVGPPAVLDDVPDAIAQKNDGVLLIHCVSLFATSLADYWLLISDYRPFTAARS